MRENAEYEARELVMRAAGLSLTELALRGGEEISAEKANKALEMAHRRRAGEPLQYITGTAGFMGMEFEVNSHTLIPRQDTETLVEALMKEIGKERAKVLDIGAGSGCVGISLGAMTGAEVTLLDISPEALECAGRNAEKNGVKARLICMDIMRELPEGEFDVIASNPPYIETGAIAALQAEVRDYEPVAALDGGRDGLDFYRRIVSAAPDMLRDGGILAFEIGFNQGNAVRTMMEKNFGGVRIIKDYTYNDRVVIGSKKFK